MPVAVPDQVVAKPYAGCVDGERRARRIWIILSAAIHSSRVKGLAQFQRRRIEAKNTCIETVLFAIAPIRIGRAHRGVARLREIERTVRPERWLHRLVILD